MRKWLLVAGIGLPGLLCLALAGIWLFYDVGQHRAALEAVVSDATGRAFRIEGELRLNRGWPPALSATSVSLANADWADDGPLVEAERVDIRIPLLPLLSRTIDIRHVDVAGAAIRLARHSDHGANWQLEGSADEASDTDSGAGWALRFPRSATLRDARITYQPDERAEAEQASVSRLTLRAPGLVRPMTLALEGRYRERDLRMEASLDPWQQFGEADADYRVHEFDWQLGDSNLTGSGRLVRDEGRPRLTGELSSDELDLRPFQGEAAKSGDDRLIPDTPIPLAPLQALDADIKLTAGRVISNGLVLEELDATLALEAGQLRLDPIRATLAGGKLEAGLGLDAGASPPMLAVEVQLDDFRPGELPALQDADLIEDAPSDFRLQGQGAGGSPAAVAGNFNGELQLSVGRGTLGNNAANIIGADVVFSLLQQINPLADEEARSDLICAALKLPIRDGVARGEKAIAMQTDKVNVLGNAVIDLATEAIAIRVKPTARSGIGVNLGTLAGGFSIGGSLTNPQPTSGDVVAKLKAAGRVGAAISTAGLSLIAEGAFDRTFATSDPCGVVLGEADTGDTGEGLLDRASDKARDVIDGLFGR
ncbi:AsmA family protein [Salinisphaera sp. P385]|uniref:AsmA family protein n=1 Tax=Spectribacter acetivorans TaxID=3075603 RepID=A0ABU3B9R2_9GAMM|nr:AsmA family protein [Salinisphaera sp. P385]MDT0619207.1 AsmA family protein [Salinisphaera sp. P385]